MKTEVLKRVEKIILKANKKFKKDSTKWKYLVREIYILDGKMEMKRLKAFSDSMKESKKEFEKEYKEILKLLK
tara:strand:+ start:243 stop:461 length:219 start_codon:yes stop_codon:yes gene_type:complete